MEYLLADFSVAEVERELADSGTCATGTLTPTPIGSGSAIDTRAVLAQSLSILNSLSIVL